MVHICVVCKSKSNTNEKLSFHLFPKDDRRGVWMQAFGLTEVSNWHRVCSKHFDREHFISSGDRMILLRDAVPLASKNATATTSLSSPFSQTLEHNDTFMEDSPVNAKRKLFDSISPLAKKNSKSSNSTRFGDLSINDFSSPNRARRNFPLVQSTISGLRSKTKNLMEKNRRLQTKVQSLQSIISDLQSNCYISDAAADNLKVNLDMLLFMFCILCLSVFSVIRSVINIK